MDHAIRVCYPKIFGNEVRTSSVFRRRLQYEFSSRATLLGESLESLMRNTAQRHHAFITSVSAAASLQIIVEQHFQRLPRSRPSDRRTWTLFGEPETSNKIRETERTNKIRTFKLARTCESQLVIDYYASKRDSSSICRSDPFSMLINSETAPMWRTTLCPQDRWFLGFLGLLSLDVNIRPG